MLKNKILIKTVSLTALISFALASSPKTPEAAMLVPISFSQMYSLAQNGEVEALRGSVHRGMNIDVMNQNGDTGLCVAARRRDSYTYNAFRAAGANPRHPCTQSVPGYESFVNSANTAPINSTSRTAYGMMGKETYKVSPWVWWGLGAVAVGAGVAIALSGGGGGGKDDPAPTPIPPIPPLPPVVNPIDSAGKNLAVNGSILDTAASGENKTNTSDLSMTNENSSIRGMNFNKDVTNNSSILNVMLKSTDGGQYTNSAGKDLNADSGVVAMSAYKGSTITNNGYLNITGYNAAIGMLAGHNSTAINNGNDASNNINLTFSGYNMTDSIIGMYADAGSNIYNNGKINGTASLTSASGGTTTATKGSMVGMEVMVINANTDSSATTSSATNAGTIKLIAGQNSTASTESVEVSIVGMGTYLDDGFLNGSKNINRAEKASIINGTDIELSYLGKYSSSDDYLRQGTGGIVGMKADANGTAINNGKITIDMSSTDSSGSTDYAVAAGMQSVHGGVITNSSSGNINLSVSAGNNRIAYGMVAVEGSGTVSGLYDIAPTVNNAGNITLEISNGYGMASYTGGTLNNSGTITLGKEDDTLYTNNIGMYGSSSKSTDIINSGDINIYSNNSTAMQNDFEGGTTITNAGNITIYKSATDSHPFAGKYSNIINSGTINYQTTPQDLSGTTGTFPDNFSFDLKDAIINTDGENSLTPKTVASSTTVKIDNKAGAHINMTGSSYTAAIANNLALGHVENNGIINIEDRDDGSAIKNIGIYVSSSVANGNESVNNNEITVNTRYSAGMVSDASAESVLLTNTTNGKITLKKDYSIGMYSSNSSSVNNSGEITLKGNNSYGIVVKGTGEAAHRQEITNNKIILDGTDSTAIYIANGSTAEILDAGKITINAVRATGIRYGNDVTLSAMPNFEITDSAKNTFTYFNIGHGTLALSLPNQISNGQTFVLINDSGNLINNTNLITGLEGSTLFKGIGTGTTSENRKTLILNKTGTTGMYAENGHTATNNGTIDVSAAGSYGMYAASGGTVVNGNSITVSGANSYGMFADSGGTATNTGSITVSGEYSFGMYAAGGGTVTNNGTIILTSAAVGSYGMYANAATPKSTNNTTITADAGTRLNEFVEDKQPPALGLSISPLSSPTLMAVNSGKIINNGLIATNSALDFDTSTDNTSSINIGNGGQFAAPSFSGNVVADSNITIGGFENEYVNQNSFIGADNGLNITSGSYLFDAQKSLNQDGNTDVIMTKKDFADVVENSSLAEFLEENYADKNNESLFNELKSADNSAKFEQNLNNLFGQNLLSDLTFEDLNIVREINFDMNQNLFNQKKGSFALADGIETVKGGKLGSAGQYALSGYSDGKTAYSVGLSIAETNNLKGKNHNQAKTNSNIMLSMPISHKTNGFELITSPKFGFNRGTYEREGLNNMTYDGTVERKTFALMNEARYPINTQSVKIIPSAEFNMIGYNLKAREDQKQYSLHIDSQNHYSVESGLGLNLEKEFMPYKDTKLKLSGGMAIYKEFADPYDLKVGMNEMSGNYKLKDETHGDKRTVLRFGAGYNVKENLDISAMIRTNIDRTNRTDAGVNLNYHFN